MSIPLDRLYHYIESVAQDVYGDTVIYRFYPHGSKNINDLKELYHYPWVFSRIQPEIICHDQEPLDFNFYQSVKAKHVDLINDFFDQTPNLGINLHRNLRTWVYNIYDKAILLHSEQRSEEAEKYQKNNFILVYYWCHAIIALDWFRYARYCKFNKNIKKTFLIYNRAWSGTREYRLKFADLLIDNNLVDDSLTSVSFDSDNHYYKNYNFKNKLFVPSNHLENFYNQNTAHSTYSADFDIADYQDTLIEVVLETLFDDSRIHLTEKILRPIACGQPFILASGTGSLEYLKSYGFKTFDSVFDESYDQEHNPVTRLQKIINTMKEIKSWDSATLAKKQDHLKEIADYNRSWFFSDNFLNIITQELRTNLKSAFEELELTNTSEIYFQTRKAWMQCTEFRTSALKETITRQEQLHAVAKARTYYNKHRNK